MNSNPNKIEGADSEKFNIKKTLNLYLRHWKWFLLGLILSCTTAFLILRYTTPQYAAFSKIMLLPDSEGGSGASALKDLSIFSEREEAAIEDEIQIILSRDFMQSIARKLNLNLQFFTQGRVNETELYKNSPIKINFLAKDSIVEHTYFNFFVNITSSEQFEYRKSEEDTPQTVKFGEVISASFGDFVITPNTNIKGLIGKDIKVRLTPINSIAQSIKNRFSIEQTSKSSKVIVIGFRDPVERKAVDLVNALISTYNESTLEKKNIRSRATVDFIDKRVELIADDLVNVDDSIVRFKTGNKVTDVTSEAGQFLNSSMLNSQQLDQARTQLRRLNYMESALGDDTEFTALPSNLGAEDGSISTLSAQYNELLRTRETKLKSAGAKNPVVLQLDQTLSDIKRNLRNSIQNSKQGLGIQISSLENQSQRIDSKIFSVPGQQSRLRAIERKQGIKESLYLYLLEKREEAAISLTATSPNLKVIDAAYGLGGPVSPNSRIVFIGALFLGLFVPFAIIYLKDLLDNKIHNREDLEKVTKNITILGEIPKIKGSQNLVRLNDRSILSESFRIIRTNFDYVMRSRDNKPYKNVLFITSTINGEGKSFFSMNMALTMANTGKKVLIIGADIRNPQIFPGITSKLSKDELKLGFTEFLADSSIKLNEVIQKHTINDVNIDVLLSGKLPPNPAELLMSDRVKDLFDTVSEQYDYVIVDTAPAMLVTDTLIISQYAGHTFYLTRANYTEKEILNFAKELNDDKKLNGMMLVVNDVKQSNFGYGAKYGYYGTPTKKRWFSFGKS